MPIEEKWRRNNRWINRSLFSTEGFEEKKESDAFSLKIILKGRENYWIGGHKIALSPGQVFWVNQGQSLQYDLPKTKEPNEGLCLFFDKKQVQEASEGLANLHLLESTRSRANSTLELPEIAVHHPALKALAEKLVMALDNPLYGRQVEELHQDILELFLQQNQFKNHRALSWPRMRRSTLHELLRRVKRIDEFLEDNYREAPSLDHLAAEIGMGAHHLQRQYKSIKGYSPFQYLQAVRIKHAKMLILKDGERLNNIAEEVGYADLPTFSKAFKRMVGLSPSEFSKNKVTL